MYSWIKTLRCAERASLQNVRCWIFYRIFDDLFCPLFCTVCMSHLTCCLEFCWGTYTANWWSNKFHQHRDRRRCTDADTASGRSSCGVYIHTVVSSVVSPGGFLRAFRVTGRAGRFCCHVVRHSRNLSIGIESGPTRLLCLHCSGSYRDRILPLRLVAASSFHVYILADQQILQGYKSRQNNLLDTVSLYECLISFKLRIRVCWEEKAD
jgi:hypothetical protein